ncbi:hypothetical protein C8R43DRAFT_184354 [Mycena crocata]|nr:hypothetical protein C8R43DRAFT_184354 [Mycena crocata]
MAPLFSIFASSQAIGLTAAGFFFFSTMGISPFNLIPIVERTDIPPQTRAPLYRHLFLYRGKRAFLTTTLGGVAAFLLAYRTRPADISLDHARALLGAAGALFLAIPHTAIWMVPIYKELADKGVYAKNGSGSGVEKERWNGIMKRFYGGNNLRVFLFGTAYALGLYALASSKVTSVL